MIDEPTNLKVSTVFVLFQLVWQIVSLACLRYTWVDLRKMHAQVENKNNPSAAVCDSYIVFDRARSCFGWLTCLRVIVWSGVCCASLVLALKYMSACSLLTLCLTVSGSYVKCACHKNTFHINLPDPLVETLALMNHDHDLRMRVCLQEIALSEGLCPVLSDLAHYSVHHWKKLLLLSGQLSIVLALQQKQCVAERNTRSDDLCDAPDQQHREERRVHGWPGHGRTKDHFLLVSMSRGVGRNQTYRDFNKLYFKWENSYFGVLYTSLLF